MKKLKTFLKKVQTLDLEQKNDKAERARGLGRKTREETGMGNHMTGECHLTPLASLSPLCEQRAFWRDGWGGGGGGGGGRGE